MVTARSHDLRLTTEGADVAGIIDSFKQGFTGDESQHYTVEGTSVRCSHCGGEDFDSGSALMNTPGMTFVRLDWANRAASVLICVKCGHVDWFLNDPERV